MKKVCFVCLGNICRSPMAELILRNMLKKRNITDIEVISRATSYCEVGSPIYTPAKRVLAQNGISGDHIAQQITQSDIASSDYILVMDSSNYEKILKVCGEAHKDKVHKLMSYCGLDKDIDDPWYTDDFEKAYEEITLGCESFLNTVLQ